MVKTLDSGTNTATWDAGALESSTAATPGTLVRETIPLEKSPASKNWISLVARRHATSSLELNLIEGLSNKTEKMVSLDILEANIIRKYQNAPSDLNLKFVKSALLHFYAEKKFWLLLFSLQNLRPCEILPSGFRHILLEQLINRVTSFYIPQSHILFLRCWGFLKSLKISPTWGQGGCRKVRHLKTPYLFVAATIIDANHRIRFHHHQPSSIFAKLCTRARTCFKLDTRMTISERRTVPDKESVWSSDLMKAKEQIRKTEKDRKLGITIEYYN